MTILLATLLMVPQLQEPASLFPLNAVKLTQGVFTSAVAANRSYMLALDPDRLLAPFLREAGLPEVKPSYENWENIGLDGHSAGHYLSALADMIASGNDTKDGELNRRLSHMVDVLDRCQRSSSDGYVGGIPKSHQFWSDVAAGKIDEFNSKWAPWYTEHKLFAGLRDAYLVGGNQTARRILLRLGDWAIAETTQLTDSQMQQMLGWEHGGMAEVCADMYAISGKSKYLVLAKRFVHQSIFTPLARREDRLTGLHANTQIPKIIGLQRLAAITGDADYHTAADFFWEDVTTKRSVSFGGNSVSEHFNPPNDFQRLLEHREGPETCNSYNMLRLTEQLFTAHPHPRYVDFYERTLYNHILSSINPEHPGYVYFTPIRPGHYRVYSQPGQGLWCCVGTGMENPGRYGQFIYAKAKDGVYVNLFIPSQLKVPGTDLQIEQKTRFPLQDSTSISVKVKRPKAFTLYVRRPGWVTSGFKVSVNGKSLADVSSGSSYVAIKRTWRAGDQVQVSLPMTTRLEDLPDGSHWYTILHGPIVLASPDGTEDQIGLRAGAGRGDHIAGGPLRPLDQMPALLADQPTLLSHIQPDGSGQPLQFRLNEESVPAVSTGIELKPFYQLHDTRYQMVWHVLTKEEFVANQERLAREEREKLARDAATTDKVAIGEQQSEIDHQLTGEGMESGVFDGRRWRHGRVIQYVLNAKAAPKIELSVTYSGTDSGRVFDIFVNGQLLTTQELKAEAPGHFVEKRYSIPVDILSSASDSKLTVRFVAKVVLAGGLFDLRLLKP